MNTALVEIVELSPGEVRAAADGLAQLLLDAHASNMALGLAAPLTADRAREVWVETASRLEPGRRVLLAAVEEGVVVGAVQIAHADAENGRHRAEIQRLAVRGDRRGAGIGRALLEAAVERARSEGLRLLWLSTHENTDADGFYEAAGWSRMGVLPDYAERPDGTLAGNVFYYRVV